MSTEDLEVLLKRMPEIAAAVNGFTSEAIQQEAFAALIAAYNGKHHSRHRPPQVNEVPVDDMRVGEGSAAETAEGNGSPPGESRPKKAKRQNGSSSRGENFKLVKDLDLHPSGKTSFETFVEEKQPKTNEDKYAITVYWLQHVAELPAVTVDHIGTIFRFTKGWREPGDLIAGLRMCSSRKGTIDTSKYDDIKTTPRGRNFVEHDLPASEKAKK